MPYTDLTSTFNFKLGLTYQLVTELAQNDAENHIPSGTVWAFFQAAAPTGWVKQTSQNDKMLRCTSGAGGGSGGTVALSSGVPIQHSHTVNSHTHDWVDHQHAWDYATNANRTISTTVFIGGTGAGQAIRNSDAGGSGANIVTHLRTRTKTDGGASGGTTAGTAPGTDTQPASNPVIAYIDVIHCSKT